MFMFLGLTLISIATVASLARYRKERKELMSNAVQQLNAKQRLLPAKQQQASVSDISNIQLGDIVDEDGQDYEVIGIRQSDDLKTRYTFFVLDTGVQHRILMRSSAEWLYWLEEVFILPTAGLIPTTLRYQNQVYHRELNSFWKHQFQGKVTDDNLLSTGQSNYFFYRTQDGQQLLIDGASERRTFQMQKVHKDMLTIFSPTLS